MKSYTIEIYKSKKNGQFGWRFIAKNGKKVACGGETYHNKKDLLKSLKLVSNFFEFATIKDTTK